MEQIQLNLKELRYSEVVKQVFKRKLLEKVTYIVIPVQIPYDAGSIFADTYNYTVWFAHKEACYFCCVTIQMDL